DFGLLRRRRLGVDVLLARRKRGRAASHWYRIVLPRGSRCVLREIDGADVVVGARHRPRLVGVVVLAQVSILGGAVVMNRVHSVNAHGFGSRGDYALGVLREGGLD